MTGSHQVKITCSGIFRRNFHAGITDFSSCSAVKVTPRLSGTYGIVFLRARKDWARYVLTSKNLKNLEISTFVMLVF
jgi:hypothetical protein